MQKKYDYDVVVVGAGPNGLSAAIVMARAGLSVLVLEGKSTIGGGTRTESLTLPGYAHDVCSAIHPMGAASPVFRALSLEEDGLEWVHPDVAVAHPLDDGTAPVLVRSVSETANLLGADADAYRDLVTPLVSSWDNLLGDILGPPQWPSHPVSIARFGLHAIRSAEGFATSCFRHAKARALFAGLAAHAAVPLSRPATSAIGLVLMLAGHTVGWPAARGGSCSITDALASRLRKMGGIVQTDSEITHLDQVPPARVVLLDVTPRQFLRMAGERLPGRYKNQLQRFRYGPGVFKIDWALDRPVPFKSRWCRKAGTVHIGGTLAEIARAEHAVWKGVHPEHPFVIMAQQSLMDDSRAPAGKHTGWAYCHVPAGSDKDMTDEVEAQVERFAPGFRETVLARQVTTAQQMERYNANYIGGDIGAGASTWRQLIFRPVVSLSPYRTPLNGVYLCSASTPPGGGVHGMCGYHAARQALSDIFQSVPFATL